MEMLSRITRRSSSPGIKYHGLQNQGATCYLNSVLQVLFMTKDFRETLRRCRQNDLFQTYLSILFEDLQERESTTQIITEELGIRSVYMQADAAECFGKIMNKIKDEEASKIFKIWLTHKNTCDCCQKEKSTDEQFWHLPLELEENWRNPFKVVDGLEMFFKESRVTGQDQLYCEDCQIKSDSRDKFEMKDHPEVLTLLLKRFKFNKWLKKYAKIQCSVEVPYTITVESQKYELYAFVEHYGDLKRGHYTVTIKSEDDDRWYKFDDTAVKLLPYQPLQTDPSHRSKDAYLLFYRKEKKTSSGDEASPPAASKQETCGLSDPSGNAVNTGEKEDEEATEGVKHVTDSEGKRVTADEEREERILLNRKIVSEDKDRSMTVDEGRDEGKSPADVEEEEETKKRAAGDRKSAGEHKTNKKLQTIYDLVNSPPGNTSSEKSDTRHEEERNEENSQSKSIFHADVQDTAAVNSDSNNDCTAKDETSGRDYSSDQVKRARVEENHTDKPTYGRTYRSNMTFSLQSTCSNHQSTQKEERRERERFDGQTTENHERYRSQAVEGQSKIQSGGNLQMRPQEDPKEEMRREDVSEKRYNRKKQQTRDTMQSRRETAAEETGDSSPAEVDTLSKYLSEINLNDSTPTEKPESRDMSTQTEDMSFPSALHTSSRNTAYVDRQSPQWVSYPVCGNCQSVIQIMPRERVLLTQTFRPVTHSLLYPIGPEIPAEMHFLDPSQVSMQTTGPPLPPFTSLNAHHEVAQQFITGAEEQRVTSYSSEGSVMSNVLSYLPCRKGTDRR